MSPSNDKENPNPIIHATDKRTHLTQSSAQLLGSEQIRRYALGLQFPPRSVDDFYDDIETTPASLQMPSTPEERLVAMALSQVAYPKEGPNSKESDKSPNLELLQNAGFPLLHYSQLQQAMKIPSFIPSGMTKPKNTTHKRDPFTAGEVFDIIRNIQDPEHPLTLEQLNVVRLELIKIVDLHPDIEGNEEIMESNEDGYKLQFSTVSVQFTPTIPHCSMATLIGLTLRVKLLRSIPPRFKVVVKIEPGTHVSEHAVNKQLADKERVRAALENEHLLGIVNRCIAGTS